MSVRLSVILCQSASGSARQRDFEGDLTARLLGKPGIDLSLMGPLERLAEDSTDRILMDGTSGDLVIMAWQAPEQSADQCRSEGVKGVRWPHRLDQVAEKDENTAERKLYFVNLLNWTSAEIETSLTSLLVSRRTQTFTLGSTPVAMNRTPSEVRADVTRRVTHRGERPASQEADRGQIVDRETDDEWDELVDKLNDLEL